MDDDGVSQGGLLEKIVRLINEIVILFTFTSQRNVSETVLYIKFISLYYYLIPKRKSEKSITILASSPFKKTSTKV